MKTNDPKRVQVRVLIMQRLAMQGTLQMLMFTCEERDEVIMLAQHKRVQLTNTEGALCDVEVTALFDPVDLNDLCKL